MSQILGTHDTIVSFGWPLLVDEEPECNGCDVAGTHERNQPIAGGCVYFIRVFYGC
jgi:hypothetical protein